MQFWKNLKKILNTLKKKYELVDKTTETLLSFVGDTCWVHMRLWNLMTKLIT